MNPGKIVDAPAMTDHLRDAAQPVRLELATRLRFDAPGGMHGAADRCMNIGLCRKESTGVMCPSYMATREEEHSTRGRANALLYALSTPDPHAALGSDRLHGILDLCLECKACKSECPLGVDMAALKTEALAAYHDQHGVPGALAYVRIDPHAEPAGLGRVSAVQPRRRMAARAGCWRSAGSGSAPPGRCPGSSGKTCAAGSGDGPTRRPRRGRRRSGELIFLADSFTTFTEPAVGRSAIELLELAGWQVRFEDAGCCGRASLSKGLVDQARRMAAGLADRLGEAAARGVPIVGVEPSCLLTLRDEYLALLPAADSARDRSPGPASAGDRLGGTTGLVVDRVIIGQIQGLCGRHQGCPRQDPPQRPTPICLEFRVL